MILFLRSLRLQRLLLLLIILFGWVSVWVLIFGKLFFYPAMFCLLAVLIYVCLSNLIELKGKTLPSENLFITFVTYVGTFLHELTPKKPSCRLMCIWQIGIFCNFFEFYCLSNIDLQSPGYQH